MIAVFPPDGADHCSGLPTRWYDGAVLVAALGDRPVLEHEKREEHLTSAGVRQPFTNVVLR